MYVSTLVAPAARSSSIRNAHSSSIVWKQSCGSLRSARRMMRLSPGGMSSSGQRSSGGTGRSCRCFSRIATCEGARNGGCPVARRYISAPMP